MGLYHESEKEMLEKHLSDFCAIDVVWEFDEFNIESASGVKLLEEIYHLKWTGILVEKDWEVPFTSYPLIYEVTESLIEKAESPRLFRFFDQLREIGIQKMIVAFADEWNQDSLVRVKRLDLDTLRQELNNVYVWCETYVDLRNNIAIQENGHPLIIEIEQP